MRCLLPERLIEDLAGINGAHSREAAQEHLEVCATCRASIDALMTPDTSLVDLVAAIAPASAGGCPAPEDLACWCAGDQVPKDVAVRIGRHVSVCESCAVAAAGLRIELAADRVPTHPGTSHHPAPSPHGASVARALLIAQVVGGLFLVALAATWLLPFLDKVELPRIPAPQLGNAMPDVDQSKWPLDAHFEYRLRNSAETHTLAFPYPVDVQLSEQYEYAVQLTAKQAGSVLLLSVDPQQRVSLLLPASGASSPVLNLQAGQSVRFPVGSAWTPVSPALGHTRFYAIFLDDSSQAQALASEALSPASSIEGYGSLRTSLDRLVVAGSCSGGVGPCALTFEYEVF